MRQFVPLLKLQSRFARRFGEAAHAPVIDIAAAIKDDAADALLFGALGNRFADLFCRRNVAAGAPPPILFGRRGGDQRDALRIINQLRVDMVYTTKNRQARARARAANLAADASMDCPPDVLSAFLCHFLYPSVADCAR